MKPQTPVQRARADLLRAINVLSNGDFLSYIEHSEFLSATRRKVKLLERAIRAEERKPR